MLILFLTNGYLIMDINIENDWFIFAAAARKHLAFEFATQTWKAGGAGS